MYVWLLCLYTACVYVYALSYVHVENICLESHVQICSDALSLCLKKWILH